MRLVIDTNVLISALFWPTSIVSEHIFNLLQNHTILRSSETYAELAEVIMRRKFDDYLSTAERELFLASFLEISEPILITKRVSKCRDPRDNKFLELAVCGKASSIITGDKDLLALHPFRRIKIMNPASL